MSASGLSLSSNYKLACGRKSVITHTIGTVNVVEPVCTGIMGYWHQRADERHGNPPPQGNQELLVVRDKVVRPQVSLV